VVAPGDLPSLGVLGRGWEVAAVRGGRRRQPGPEGWVSAALPGNGWDVGSWQQHRARRLPPVFSYHLLLW